MELDLRKQSILKAIVQDYVATAEPVGSHVLVERYELGVRSATIRNEMAELSERGFLRQPHTSAGRVPSDLGYRFYVNRLMPLPVIQQGESERMRTAVESAASELDAIVRRTCQILAEMTNLPAVATPPDAGQTGLRQIFVTPAGTSRTLLVLLFSTGRTENRLLEVAVSASDALALANALNERLGGRPLSVLADSTQPAEPPPPELAHLAPIWGRLAGETSQTARNIAADESAIFVEGATTVLALPEFREVERLAQFLRTLQERAAVLEMLGRALNAGPPGSVRVTIGHEAGRPELAGYSMITSPYFAGRHERGTIGVLGPTRMDYARTSAAVGLMARTMTELLTRLNVSP